MSQRLLRPLLLILLFASSWGFAGVGMMPAAAEGEEDRRDGEPREFEVQVAADARGDVLVHWPGTVDLYYLTVGELFSLSMGDSFLLMRLGYNITLPGKEDLPLPSDGPTPLVPDPPPQVDPDPFVTINITFNITHERSVTVGLYTNDHGRSWTTNHGRLVANNGNVDGHQEVLFIAPLRRFGLAAGDTLSDWNITAFREARVTDTMQQFDMANDYLPRYVPIHPLLDDPLSNVPSGVPLPTPLPFPTPTIPALPPEPPVPLPDPPVPVPGPTDVVPNDPYAYPPAPPGGMGIPYGAPTVEDLRNWVPDAEDRDVEPPPVDPERLVDDPSASNGAAWNVTHTITEGKSRFVARAESTAVMAGLSKVGSVNFTLENLMEETDQNVGMFVAGNLDDDWLFGYALDMPRGIKSLPGGGRTEMGFYAAPRNVFADPSVTLAFIFLSDWGGIDISVVTFVSDIAPVSLRREQQESALPDRLFVNLVNEDDPFRVNDVRKLMLQVREARCADGTCTPGRYVSGFDSVRAFIYPVGARPSLSPYQFDEKAWMDGIYEIDYVFDRPGAWVVHVHFYDYQADETGEFRNIRFIVRVDYAGESRPLMPLPAAFGSLGLVVLGVVVREKLTKSR